MQEKRNSIADTGFMSFLIYGLIVNIMLYCDMFLCIFGQQYDFDKNPFFKFILFSNQNLYHTSFSFQFMS